METIYSNIELARQFHCRSFQEGRKGGRGGGGGGGVAHGSGKIENSRFTEIKTDFSRITHIQRVLWFNSPLQHYRADVLTILHDYCVHIKLKGSCGSWKTWKVLEFYNGIFQAWKVLEIC